MVPINALWPLAVGVLGVMVLVVAVNGLFLGWLTATALRAMPSPIHWDAALAALSFLVVGWIALIAPCPGCIEAIDYGIIRNRRHRANP
jgi:hypothetical protein